MESGKTPEQPGARFAADGHVHIYPLHETMEALRALLEGLKRLDSASGMGLAFFAERTDCRAFEALSRTPQGTNVHGIELRTIVSGQAMLLRAPDGYSALLLAGRQTATRENVELLSLVSPAAPPDGEPAEDTVRRIQDAQGVPVLAWAPGKWFFKRRRIVERLLSTFPPSALLLGDSSLRPIGWAKPRLMRLAESMGFGITAGSDPLPVPGEERLMGSYGFLIRTHVGLDDPLGDARRALLEPGAPVQLLGRRSGPLAVLRRLAANAAAKKKASCS